MARLSSSGSTRLAAGLIGLFSTWVCACERRPASGTPAKPAALHAAGDGSLEASAAAKGPGPTAPPADDQPSAALAPAPAPRLPDGLVLGKPVDMPVDNDKPLRVTHASGNVRHAILYLQGMCSDAKSADGWVDLASERGTVIALRPDVSCLPERQGYKWPTEPGLIEARVERALELVREARGGLLDVDVVTLFGYSQGSGRAELLASRRPKRYSRVVLGGHPSVVYVPHFAGVERVAFLGGELEKTEDMRASSAALARAGVESQFFLLPGAAHGSYGPDQRRIVPDVFDWLGVPSVSP